MFERLTPEMWQWIAVVSACAFVSCLGTTSLLLWRLWRQRSFEWLQRKIDEINGPGKSPSDRRRT
jgi:hypothetical protein